MVTITVCIVCPPREEFLHEVGTGDTSAVNVTHVVDTPTASKAEDSCSERRTSILEDSTVLQDILDNTEVTIKPYVRQRKPKTTL